MIPNAIKSDINRLNRWSIKMTIKISTKVTQLIFLKPRNTLDMQLNSHLIGHFIRHCNKTHLGILMVIFPLNFRVLKKIKRSGLFNCKSAILNKLVPPSPLLRVVFGPIFELKIVFLGLFWRELALIY